MNHLAYKQLQQPAQCASPIAAIGQGIMLTPDRRPEIQEQLDRMNGLLNDTLSSIGVLRERIGPILRADCPKPEANVKPEGCSCAFAQTLLEFNQRLREIQSFINDAYTRVEL